MAHPTLAGVFVEEKGLAAPRAARAQVQRPRQSLLPIFLDVSGEEAGVPPPLTFFGQYACVCKHMGHSQGHLFIILAERQMQITEDTHLTYTPTPTIHRGRVGASGLRYI